MLGRGVSAMVRIPRSAWASDWGTDHVGQAPRISRLRSGSRAWLRKPSGAGGGDAGFFVIPPDRSLDGVRTLIKDRNIHMLPLSPDASGIQVERVLKVPRVKANHALNSGIRLENSNEEPFTWFL